ncbi:MAG: biopolymer transporter ExbD [Luteolibacter sp.]
MKFHRSTRQRSHIQVIPLIDILLILLIFFVVTTTFKKPRNALQINLPTVSEVPTDQIVEPRSVLAVDALGNIKLDTLEVPEGLLESYLVAFRNQNPGRKLELEADRKLPLERLITVWDALVKAGIEIKDVPARIQIPEK